LTENDDIGGHQMAEGDQTPVPAPQADTQVSTEAQAPATEDDGTTPRLRLSWGGATHPGEIRPVNQDALYADRGLFVVADGMGGHQAGEVASRISVKTLAGRDHSTVDELVAGVTAANDAVWEHARSGPEFKGMGTTLTALAVIGDGRPPRLGLVNVGDSRAYQLRGGEFVQLTEDHSYVAELVRRGQITEADAETHPYRNMVTRAIGVAETIEVDRWEMTPEAGDVFLLCSDGLVNELEESRILELLVGHDDPTESAKQLISAANEAGGRDNITVVIVRVDTEQPTESTSTEEHRDASPLDTGVIAPVPDTGTLEQTAEMVGLTEQLEETTAALAALDEIEADLSTEEIDDSAEPDPDSAEADPDSTGPDDEVELSPPSRPADPLSAFDLPALKGDDTSLPWLKEGPPDVGPTDEPARAPDTPKTPPVESPSAEPSAGEVSATGTESDPTIPITRLVDTSASAGPVNHLEPAMRGWRAPVAVTWRSLLFIALVIGVIAGSGALFGWYARSAYYVGFSGDEVVVYQGRPDGVLWFDPTLEEGTGIFRQDLSDSTNLQIADLYETGTLAGARAFVEEIRPGPGSQNATSPGDSARITTTTGS